MCIRDRYFNNVEAIGALSRVPGMGDVVEKAMAYIPPFIYSCLLYTSDAADERSSVDLGGRRIIKKKTTEEHVADYSTYK